MKRIMAVYDEDPFYADRFAEFVNQKEAAFHAVAFTSLVAERDQVYKLSLLCHAGKMLLVGDEVEAEALEGIRAGQVIRLGETEFPGKEAKTVYKYQATDSVLREVLLSGKGAAGADGSRRTEKQDNRRLFPCWKMRKNGICIYVGAGSGPKQQGAFSDVGRVLRTVCPYGNGI